MSDSDNYIDSHGDTIWCNYGNWDEISKKDDEDYIRYMICFVGHKEFKPNFISEETAKQLESIIPKNASIIDFGCGLGRNVPLLKKYFKKVYGYDLPSMIDKLKDSEDKTLLNMYDSLEDNIDNLLKNNIEFLFESVVFQHIVSEDYCSKITEKIAKSKIKTLFVLYNSGNPRPIAIDMFINKHDFHITYETIEDKSFYPLPHTFLILEKK